MGNEVDVEAGDQKPDMQKRPTQIVIGRRAKPAKAKANQRHNHPICIDKTLNPNLTKHSSSKNSNSNTHILYSTAEKTTTSKKKTPSHSPQTILKKQQEHPDPSSSSTTTTTEPSKTLPPKPNILKENETKTNLKMLKENEETEEEANHFGFQLRLSKKVSIDDFRLMKRIGQGTYGRVHMVRKRDTGEVFAMKSLVKKELLRRNQVEHTKTERRIMFNINHPFIVSLRYAFQTDQKLYMVFDFFNGGELFFHLKSTGCFSFERAQFYSGEILLGLECLHENGIIYRDLKPENVLLDEEGHVRITDFGLSKDGLKGQGAVTHTYCGTPEYLAPEIISEQGYTKTADFWSFGMLLYEMLTGFPPWYDENLNKMYENILTQAVPIPSMGEEGESVFSKHPETRSLIIGLLQKNPKHRLGRSFGANEVKAHKFYENIDFGKLLRKEYKPPFDPQVRGNEDLSQIDPEFLMMPAKDSLVAQTGSMLKAKDMFQDFSFYGEKELVQNTENAQDPFSKLRKAAEFRKASG